MAEFVAKWEDDCLVVRQQLGRLVKNVEGVSGDNR